MSEIPDEIYERIVAITGKDRVRIDPFERRMYSHDLASLPKLMELGFKMMPDLVIKPKGSMEIAEIVKIACEEGIPIVPRGGASWGLGGAMPIEGGIVLDLTRMNKVLDVDMENLMVRVQTGITWKRLYDILFHKGFIIGSYPSSAMAATVGGWINTGGVGVGTYKYGSAAEHVKSLEVVLPTGNVLETGNIRCTNYFGRDLNKVFFGAEGTLGIVTQASLRMYPAPEELRPLSFTFNDLKDMATSVKKIAHSNIIPLHMSFLDKNHFDFLKEVGMTTHGPEQGGMFNLALEGDSHVLDIEEIVLNSIITEQNGERMERKIAQHEWDERFFELRTKRAGPTATLGEVFVPLSRMSQMIAATYKLIKKMKLRAAITGMISDRNTVVFMPYYLSDERKLIRNMVSLSFVKKLGDLAFAHGGRPAGLGLFFSGNLKKMYGPGRDNMKDIKAALDPYDIMNPGKTTEGLTRFGIPIPAFALNMGMNVMAWVKHLMTRDKGVTA